ncbi:MULTISPECIES: bifunctional aspartate kinase/homoserine dehydrogenase I [Capnocytophaga]|uniref:bifunctional aspartate kinase/homoserine dehydrogenase I n=1 Tax=Capnocytophaga TaxID=1016 RepID=UPI00020C5CFA|nr:MULTISPECIES: bifunctional aspartate kinase/homoserine dehydrogenase I [unclassified Capnocytophaga]KHE68728.1 homoserine dehydrogenase [Capnocytophaga sp. oral taxon 329 str. F0087]QGS18474.1 bifunctional aspartate kinase/homoserine dehydrogenase I [Capnocytophaga sp. FDAARGOS_737]
MKILKFGGKSLANDGIEKVIDIIITSHKEPLSVVVSARGNTTDQLEALLEKASKGEDYTADFQHLKNEQQYDPRVSFEPEFQLLEKLLEGVSLLKDYSPKTKDLVLAQGELMSAKLVAALLKRKGLESTFVDSREIFKTDAVVGNAQIINSVSEKLTRDHFATIPPNHVAVVTGFIASTEKGDTTTLGRNGSNYSAALLANYLNASELQNYTHVDGIFTANPELVPEAKIIRHLSYEEANELANFGASILHAKTIIPLIEKGIPLRIKNTFNSDDAGTLIHKESEQEGIKSISVIKDNALIVMEGRGLLGKVGVDARIFRALAQKGISVSIISQGSSERGVGLVVASKDAKLAKAAIDEEFSHDFYTNDVSSVSIVDDVAVISIVGQPLSTFHHPYNALIRNQIVPLLINNAVTGKNVSLVLKTEKLHKALNVIHGEIFGVSRRINLVIFGKGTVGGTLINQVIAAHDNILQRKNISLRIVAIANSQKILTAAKGIGKGWEEAFEREAVPYNFDTLQAFVDKNHLENLIAVDVTASKTFVDNYIPLIKSGYDLVSANKIANTISFSFYQELRKTLKQYQKTYLYETNVGAGLPLIDTIRLLHHSGENITRIKGIFSGTLSYLFNTFSAEDKPFSEVLQHAINSGYTEPDPREDLCGNDVGRKLLILARELDLGNEFTDVKIQNLIPEHLREGSVEDFLQRLDEFNSPYQQIKEAQEPDHVLRYVGDLHGDLASTDTVQLDVSLVSVPRNSALGQVKGADSIFEIYTESYGDNPIVIQGAGAGASVTARGVFGDILRLAEKSRV